VDRLGDVHARCGWFATESFQGDVASRQARLRLKRTLETCGIEGRWDRPTCHFLRGYFAGIFRSLFWTNAVGCAEVSCRGKGDSVSESVVTGSIGREDLHRGT
jgi:predicted hydrocarbon binding protein